MKPLIRKLLQAAIEARRRAYAPYSKFHVGCAVEADSGRIYTGTNVENASFGLTICAERNALFQMVAAGDMRFRTLLVTADTERPVRPCGACLQVMVEFASPNSRVVMAGRGNRLEEKPLAELIPLAFAPPLEEGET